MQRETPSYTEYDESDRHTSTEKLARRMTAERQPFTRWSCTQADQAETEDRETIMNQRGLLCS